MHNFTHNKYILLHDWEGNTGEYSVRGWQYCPDRREGQYITRELNIPLYCPTQRNAIMDLLKFGRKKMKGEGKRKKKKRGEREKKE